MDSGEYSGIGCSVVPLQVIHPNYKPLQDMPGTLDNMIISNPHRVNFMLILKKYLNNIGYLNIKYRASSDNNGDTIYSGDKKVGLLTKKGSGANATVMKINFFNSNSSIAIKIGEKYNIIREYKWLTILNKDNPEYIIRNLSPLIYHDNLAAIIMPCYDTDLACLIRSPEFNSLGKDHVKYILFNIFKGLAHVHSLNIMHCDLKPANILINLNPFYCAITDFGLANLVSKAYLNPHVCTRFYRAPEIISCSGYSLPADIWSVGCIISELVTGDVLFRGHPCGDLSPPADKKAGSIPLDFKFGVYDLITEEEKTHKAVLKFAKMKNSDLLLVDLLMKCIRIKPEERITAKEALTHAYFS